MSAHALPEKVRKGDPKRDRGNRTGFSTGANSAAAAAAATLGLVHGRVPDFIDCVLPNTQRVRFAITGGWTDGRRARAVSIKDAGDDPDVTHGAVIRARVRRGEPGSGLVFRGGPGVGRVTLPGLPLAVGEPANLVLVDPSARAVVDRDASASKSRNNPYHGRDLPDPVVATVWAGKVTHRR